MKFLLSSWVAEASTEHEDFFWEIANLLLTIISNSELKNTFGKFNNNLKMKDQFL